MKEKIFINRDNEKSILLKALDREGAELIILYGRRRVGKSRLLSEITEKTTIDIDVMLEDADYQSNVKKTAEAVAERFQLPSFTPHSFREIFQALPPKSTIILDEYSYLPHSAGEFQAIWEEIAKPKKLKIILCGSLIRVMEDLSHSLSSPLYGRATQIMKLLPLQARYVKTWYSKKTKPEDWLSTYFTLGGIPRYLEIADKPGAKNLIPHFFSPTGFFVREGKLLLKESFPQSQVIPKILFSIAQGETKASQIASQIGISAGEIGKYLQLLEEYGFIEKRFPLVGGGKKDVRFYSLDPFFSFWVRFVWPYYSEIDTGYSKVAIEHFQKNFQSYSGRAFEKTVREFINEYPSLLPSPFTRVGNQWGKIPSSYQPGKGSEAYEIDFITLDENNHVNGAGECKWKEKVSAPALAEKLLEKVQSVPGYEQKHLQFLALFAKSFQKKITEHNTVKIVCYDLRDMNQITQ